MLHLPAHLRACLCTPLRARPFSVSAVSAAVAAVLLFACATEHVETRKECNHRCSVVYETCTQRSFGGDTLNNCGNQDVSCNAMCPSH